MGDPGSPNQIVVPTQTSPHFPQWQFDIPQHVIYDNTAWPPAMSQHKPMTWNGSPPFSRTNSTESQAGFLISTSLPQDQLLSIGSARHHRSSHNRKLPTRPSSDDGNEHQRRAHARVERRYRDNMNALILELQEALDAANKQEYALQGLHDQEHQTLPAGSVKKADTLLNAIKYINETQVTIRHMTEELVQLRAYYHGYGCWTWGGSPGRTALWLAWHWEEL